MPEFRAAFAHLFTDRVQFDWSIIEEAAKATGNELLSPLQLSQRYLMIGDHQQLPPFNADELAAILGALAKVREVLQAISELRLPAWRVVEVQRLQQKFNRGEEQVSEAAAEVCEAARRQILLFQNLIEPVLKELRSTKSTFDRMLT